PRVVAPVTAAPARVTPRPAARAMRDRCRTMALAVPVAPRAPAATEAASVRPTARWRQAATGGLTAIPSRPVAVAVAGPARGGGGGGGLYGGGGGGAGVFVNGPDGGGDGGGGGGGSGLCPSTCAQAESGVRTGDGTVTVTWTVPEATPTPTATPTPASAVTSS